MDAYCNPYWTKGCSRLQLTVIASIEEPALIERILAHLTQHTKAQYAFIDGRPRSTLPGTISGTRFDYP